MNENLNAELATLRRMTVGWLREKYGELFGEVSRSGNRRYLLRKIAWRLQALREGGLSERARRRAMELADDADIRTRPPAGIADTSEGKTNVSAKKRLPPSGAVITREYKGRKMVVTVLGNGFEYDGNVYRSLTAVAEKVTGTHWNGYHFFGLTKGGGRK